MVWRDKIRMLVDSTESMELRVFRDRVRQDLMEEISRVHEDMTAQGRVPYNGEWLTPDEVMLDRENERKEKLTRLILIILLYSVILLLSLGLAFYVWHSAN